MGGADLQAAKGEGQRGVALLLVLWTLALLAVVGVALTADARTDLRLARNIAESAEARAAADGGVWWAVERLIDASAEDMPRGDGAPMRQSIGGLPVDVAVQDEAGKLDLNAASPELLANLLRVLGHGGDADSIAAAIDGYRQQKRARDGEEGREPPFTAIEELRLVHGVTPALYASLLPFVSVYGVGGQIDPMVAPATVLRAVPGVAPQDANDFVAARASQPPGIGSLERYPSLMEAAPHFTWSGSSAVTVTATAKLPGGATFIREAVIDLEATKGRSYTVLAWRRGLGGR